MAWRQQAEFAANYLNKGRLVAVQGRLQIRQWTTQDGQRRQSAEVVCDQLQPLDRRREGPAEAAAEEEPTPSGEAEVGEQGDAGVPWEGE